MNSNELLPYQVMNKMCVRARLYGLKWSLIAERIILVFSHIIRISTWAVNWMSQKVCFHLAKCNLYSKHIRAIERISSEPISKQEHSTFTIHTLLSLFELPLCANECHIEITTEYLSTLECFVNMFKCYNSIAFLCYVKTHSL